VSARRRAVLLAGLAVLLGVLAASDIAGREAALEARVGRPVPVVVVRRTVPAGERLSARVLAVRTVPARFAPAGSYARPAEVAGLRAAVDLPARVDLVPSLLDDGSPAPAAGAPVRVGERVAEVVARGSADLIVPGSRVDVLITRRRGDGGGDTQLALEDAEVLGAAPATASGPSDDGGPRVAVSLRTTVRQAVQLAAAHDLGHELRVLPRAAGDRRHGLAGLRSTG
jgi:pilus assembly protein CpaB